MKTPKYLLQAIYTPRTPDGYASVTIKTTTCLQQLNELLKEFTNIDTDTRLEITITKLTKHDIENNIYTVTE